MKRPPTARVSCRPVALIALALTATSTTLCAQTIGVTLGSPASPAVQAPPSGKIAVPVTIDLANAGILDIASLQASLTWNATRLTFDSIRVTPTLGWSFTSNTSGAGSGSISFTTFNTDALPASGPLALAYFTAGAMPGGTRVRIAPTASGSEAGQSILNMLRPRGLDVCIATSGRWGDVNDDASVNVIDAQQIARFGVGLSVANANAVAQRGDVNADASVNVIDAQQIARFAVGLSASVRINTPVFTPPVTAAIALVPSATQTMTTGGTVEIAATPRDAGNADLTGCASLTWASSNPLVASVSGDGVVRAHTAGNAVVTATSVHTPAVSASIAIVVSGNAIAITTPSPLPSATQTLAYSMTLAASGGAGGYTWTLTNGALPPGVSLGSATGTIAGTPTASGTFNFTIQAAAAGAQNGSKAFTLVVAPATRDLVVTEVTASAAGTVGGTIDFSAIVRNQGTVPTGAFRVGLYFSTDASITTADVYAEQFCLYLNGLEPNVISNCGGTLTIPGGLAPGTYYVGAIVDDLNAVPESNETNNARAAATPTTITGAGGPDLVLDVVTAPPTGSAGGTITVQAIARNQGTASTGAFRLGFYLSADATITATDVFTGWSCAVNTGLVPAETWNCGGPIVLPQGLSAGTYHFGAIADDLGQVPEASETNNGRAAAGTIAISSSGPDLVVDAVSASAVGVAGGTITVQATIRNQGTVGTAPFRVAFYYSTDPNITTADAFSGSACVYSAGLAANTTNDCAGSISVPASLAAGTYYVGAVADDLATASEANETNNTRAATQTTLISQPSGSVNLTVDGLYLTQATQTYGGTVPLVAGRAAILRVFALANNPNVATPAVRVRFFQNGNLVDTRTIASPSASVPTSIVEGDFSTSWHVAVSGSLIQPGLSILAEVDPTNAVQETSESDNMFPTTGAPKVLDVRTTTPFNVMLVPVFQTPNGQIGDVTEANKGTYTDFTTRVYPLASVNAIVHAPYSYGAIVSTSYDATWSTLLSEMAALRAAEGLPRYYYGVLKTANGGSGLGYLGFPAAIGIDWTSPVNGSNTTWRSMTAAHEWGHNFNRQHVACGGPTGTDPNYPYNPGTIGRYGYDFGTAQFVPLSFVDLMSYCTPLFVSDYTYNAVLNYRAANPGAVMAAAPRRSLLIWGRIGPDGIVLEPAFEVDAPSSLPPRAGPYRVHATGSDGRAVFDLSFDGESVDHLPDVRHFAYVVPLPDGPAPPASIRLVAEGREATRSSAPGAAVADATPIATATAGAVSRTRVQWNATQYPMALVRDPVTGQVLTFARGGDVGVESAAPELDVVFSDGVRSVRQRIRVNGR